MVFVIVIIRLVFTSLYEQYQSHVHFLLSKLIFATKKIFDKENKEKRMKLI